jgi:chorismate mutase/prephenate dehydrogenase
VTLEAFRTEMREVDCHIAELIAKRIDLARRIGDEKARAGLPLRDYATERRVHETMEAHARRLGIEIELIRDITTALIRGAVRLQSRERVVAQSVATGSACVVGGHGHMGRWCCGYLASLGYEVRIADAGDSLSPTLDADLTMVAVPLDRTGAVLRELVALRPGGLILEIASLKSEFSAEVPGWVATGLRFVSIHPMFGPDADQLAGQNLIICEAGCPEAERAAATLFAPSALHIVRLPLADHDRIMAWVLNLPHLVNLLAGALLADSDEPASRLIEVGGTTFNRQCGVTAQVVSESPDLYFHIQRLNPYRDRLVLALRDAVEQLDRQIRLGQRDSFAASMRRSRDWFEAMG